MTLSLRAPLLALAIVAALGLAACGGDDEDSSSDDAAAGASSALSTATIDGATVLVNSNGQALYTSDLEQNGKVACTDDCTSIWMPATSAGASAPSVDGAEVGVVKRPDGAEQLTFDGAPLYSFTQEGPDELTGDGVTDSFGGQTFKWSAAVVSGTPEPADDSGADSDSSQPSGGYSY